MTQSLKPVSKRAGALDALRGYAILTMVLSGLVPGSILPRWMYHGYYMPPSMAYTVIGGITWTDLVLPFFLFAMGAAFPLALTRRIEQGMSQKEVLFSVFCRWFLLLAFAIYNMHTVFSLHAVEPTIKSCLTGLLGFVFLFPMWGKFPWKLSPLKEKIMVWGSWIVAFGYLGFLCTYQGEPFSIFRNNIILHVLTNMAVVGSLIWYFTRKRIHVRLAILGICLAINLTFKFEGPEKNWIQIIGNTYDIPYWSSLIKSSFQTALEEFFVFTEYPLVIRLNFSNIFSLFIRERLQGSSDCWMHERAG